MTVESPRFKVKICMVGNAAVGKTSLINRYVHNRFSSKYKETLGVNAMIKDTVGNSPEWGEVPVRLLICDIMGETSILEWVGETYFHGVKGVIAVCDITRYSTFEDLGIWLNAVKAVAGDVPKILAVNKSDLKGQAMVLYDEHEVKRFASENDARAFMTSAKTGENVELIFNRIASDIIGRLPREIDVQPLS